MFQLPTDAADRGTRWHGAAERYLKGEAEPDRSLWPNEKSAFAKFSHTLNEKIVEHFGNDTSSITEKQFVEPFVGIAGAADLLLTTAEDKGDWNKTIVCDFKFSDKEVFGARGGLLKSKWCFPERALQLAMYAVGLKIRTPRLVNIFCNAETGECEFYEWEDPERYMHGALLCTMMYYKYRLGSYPQSEGGDLFEMCIKSFFDEYFGD